MSFTPGPWEVAKPFHYAGTDLNVHSGPNGTGAYVCSAGQRGDVEAEANSRLIAAAPDLLAALRVIRQQWAGHSEVCAAVASMNKSKCDCDWPKIAAQCDAALTKAQGQPSVSGGEEG